jgi:SAM-dependent methyltransferase
LSFYGEDLAWMHDAGFGDVARAAVDEARAHVSPPGLVIDLGCGSGITAAALLQHGFDVLGVDVSEAMLRIARERAPRARFVHASLDDFELEPAVAVLAIGEVLNYGRERRDLPALFRRVRAALEPGGLFLAGISGPGREPEGLRRSWRDGPGWLVCLEAREEGPVITRKIATFREHGDGWRRRDEVHLVQLYAAGEVLAGLREAGFEASVIGAHYRMPVFAGVAT